MLVCAEKLQDYALIDYYVKEQGQLFYKENLENMARYPPQYGISSTSDSKIAGSLPTTEVKDEPSES